MSKAFKPQIVLWCNGNTQGFGPCIGGSNPSGTTIITQLETMKMVITGLFIVSVIILSYIIIIRPFILYKRYHKVLKHQKNGTVFIYKSAPGVFGIIKNVERIKENILLTIEVKYPDASTDNFKSTLEVFNDYWEEVF